MGSNSTKKKAPKSTPDQQAQVTYSLTKREVEKLFSMIFETRSDEVLDRFTVQAYERDGRTYYRVDRKKRKRLLSLMKSREYKEFVVKTVLEYFDCKAPVKLGRPKQTGMCIICLEELKSGQLIRKLPCSHELHRKCIDEWLMQSFNCPVCRSFFPGVAVPKAIDLFLQIVEQKRLSRQFGTATVLIQPPTPPSLSMPGSLLHYLY